MMWRSKTILGVAIRQTLAVWFFLTVLYYLFGLPVEAIIYSGVLVLTFSFLSLGYIAYREKVHLDALKRSLEYDQETGHQSPPEATYAESRYFREALLALGHRTQERENDLLNQVMQRQDLLATWVHQIKTPISALHLLLTQEDLASHKEKMQMELFKIEQYVETVLHMERIESSQHDLLLGPLNLEHTVRSIVRKLRGLFIGKGLSVAIDISKDAPHVLSDEKWLGIALEQLMTNAVKYTLKGGIRIVASGPLTFNVDSEGLKMGEQMMCLRIEDTGIGIAEEDLPLIFEKGFTGYHGRYDQRATGLGLYLTKKALKQIGAYIELTSKAGVGTVVTIWLPLANRPLSD